MKPGRYSAMGGAVVALLVQSAGCAVGPPPPPLPPSALGGMFTALLPWIFFLGIAGAGLVAFGKRLFKTAARLEQMADRLESIDRRLAEVGARFDAKEESACRKTAGEKEEA